MTLKGKVIVDAKYEKVEKHRQTFKGKRVKKVKG